MSEVEEGQADNVESCSLQIKSIAESGCTDSEWNTLKELLKRRIDNIIEDYQKDQKTDSSDPVQMPNIEKFDSKQAHEEILDLLESFSEPPFTIQRICEILYCPTKYYDRVCPFIRGLEKNLRVISSNDWPVQQVIEPAPPEQAEAMAASVSPQPMDPPPPPPPILESALEPEPEKAAVVAPEPTSEPAQEPTLAPAPEQELEPTPAPMAEQQATTTEGGAETQEQCKPESVEEAKVGGETVETAIT